MRSIASNRLGWERARYMATDKKIDKAAGDDGEQQGDERDLGSCAVATGSAARSVAAELGSWTAMELSLSHFSPSRIPRYLLP